MKSRALTTILVGVVGAVCVSFGYWIGSGKEPEGSISGRSSSSSGFKLLAELKKGDSGLAGGVLREEKSNVGKELTFGKEPSKRAEFLSSASLIEVVNSGKEVAIEKSKEFSSVAKGSAVYAKLTPKEAERPPVEECHFSPGQFPKYRPLFISEVAWAGTPEDSGNEWIELKNASSGPVNAGGYWLLDKAEQIKVHLPSVLVPADGFYLLERGDDAVPGIEADAIYTGGLSNSNETLRLFDPWCNLLDEVVAEPKWPAGESASKRSMERGSDWEWYTYTGKAVNDVLGTPGKKNIAASRTATAPSGASSPSSSTTVTQSESVAVATSSTDATTTASSSEETIEPASPVVTESGTQHLILSEIFVGSEQSSDDEYVELFNPTGQAIDLTGWSLKKKSSSGSESSLVASTRLQGKSVAAGSYFLIARDQKYLGSVTPDASWASSISLAYTNNAVLLYDASGAITDETAWAELAKGQSWKREPITGDTFSVGVPSPRH